jgi:hypothetical protein
MNNLFNFYENQLAIEGFYSKLKGLINNKPNQFNKELLLPSTGNSNVTNSNDCIVNAGDIRIDMPILIGNSKPETRILILGLEPRHTHDFYNVIKKGKMVYATPFGIDRWYADVKQNVYASAFKKYLDPEKLFLFSDFVKEYLVIDPSNKINNSTQARFKFEELFESKYQHLLEQEIKLFNPNIIIGLGKTDISKKVPSSFIKNYDIQVISHPINGNFPRMQKSMDGILGSKK